MYLFLAVPLQLYKRHTRKPAPGTLVEPYKKPGIREPGPLKKRKTETLKSKTRYPSGAGKAVPNVTLRKRPQNLENKTSNTLISFNLITAVSTLQGHL